MERAGFPAPIMVMTKEEIKRALEKAIEDEGQAVKEYQHLADEMQAWVNTLPFPQRSNYQWMANTVRFIQGDEARHRTTLQNLLSRLE